MLLRRRGQLRRLLVSGTLMVLFVAVQATVVSHLDLDRHSQDTPCALCVGHSVLGSANVAHVHFALLDVRSPEPSQEPYRSESFSPPRFRFARAPPLSS